MRPNWFFGYDMNAVTNFVVILHEGVAHVLESLEV